MKDWKPYTFNEAVECNPKVTIKKGDIIENCEMEDINPSYKFLYPREGKLYKGSNSKFQNGDTVFARITPCLENGKIAQVKGLKKNCGIGSTEFFVFRGKKNISDNDFVYYLSKTNLVRDTAVNSMTGASGRQRADIKAVKKISVNLPPLPTQQRIASILSAYDDLIEVNNQRIKLLEQTARELYKEWFVRMRFPGYKQAKFKKGVPEGWEVVKLGELVKPQYGYTESSVKNDSLPKFLRVMDINKTSYVDWENVPNCPITENEFKKYRLVKDDLIIARMADPGKVAIIENDVNAVFASYLIRLKIISKDIKPYWLFYTLGSDYFQGTFVNADSSSTRGSINGPTICGVKILLPTKNIIEEFDINVRPFREMISLLVQQNTQLRQIRDRLLPRLISGKLQVSESRMERIKG